MLRSLRRTIAVLRERQILHKLGIVISVTIIVTACFILFHMLRNLDVEALVKALRGTDRHAIALAALFVVAGYFTLTFYDLFALRTIGRSDVPLPRRRAGGFHQLFDRPQCRRQRLHRRRGALSHLFGLGPDRDRGRQDLLSRRPDVLARQRRRARHRRRSAIPKRPPRDRSTAAWFNRVMALASSSPRWSAYVAWVWIKPAADRPRHLDGDAAGRPADAAADRDRHRRSRVLRAGDVRAGARRAQSRLRHRRRDFRLRDAAGFRQPFARRARRVRRRHAGRRCGSSTRKICSRACCCSGCSIISFPS